MMDQQKSLKNENTILKMNLYKFEIDKYEPERPSDID